MKKLNVYHILFSFFFIRLAVAALLPIFGDEAYYFVWSQHLQLSYFDHPGMVSWLIRLSHSIFPEQNPLGLRFSFIFLSLLSSLLWKIILDRRQFPDRLQILFFSFLFLNPLLGLGSVMATPDGALTFFWTLSYFFFDSLLMTGSLWSYAGLGIALGLGFCSKYHIVLFVLSGLIYILYSKKYRALRPIGVALTLTFGALFSLPVLIWNYQNQWSSFLFQINHGFGESEFSWQWPIGYLVAQSFIVNPFIVFTLFRYVSSTAEKIFSLSQLGFFFISSFKSVVEGNWPLTSHFHSVLHFVQQATTKVRNAALLFWAGFYILIGIFFATDASQKVRKNLINSSQLSEVELSARDYRPLYGASYQVSSLLTWKTGQVIPKLRGLSRHDFYDSLPESLPAASEFYVLKYDYSEWPVEYAKYKKSKVRNFDNVGLELYHFTYE